MPGLEGRVSCQRRLLEAVDNTCPVARMYLCARARARRLCGKHCTVESDVDRRLPTAASVAMREGHARTAMQFHGGARTCVCVGVGCAGRSVGLPVPLVFTPSRSACVIANILQTVFVVLVRSLMRWPARKVRPNLEVCGTNEASKQIPISPPPRKTARRSQVRGSQVESRPSGGQVYG